MVKLLARLFGYFLLATLLVAVTGAWWLMQQPRSVNQLKPQIVAALNPANAPYRIDVGSVMLDWRDVGQIGRIRLENMVVTLLDGSAFAAVPTVEVSLDPLGFLPNRSVINRVILVAPKLYLTRSAEGTVRMGLEENGQSLPLSELLGFFASSNSTAATKSVKIPFRAVAVERAALTLKDEVSGIAVLQSAPFTIRLSKNAVGDVTGMLAMPFLYNGSNGRIDARLSGSLTSSDYYLHLSLASVPMELICQFGGCPPDIQGAGKLSGKTNFTISKDYRIVGGNVAVRMKAGTLIAPAFFPEPLKLRDGTLSAHIAGRGQHFVIDRTRLSLEDITLDLSAQWIQKGDYWRLIMDGAGSPLDVTKLYKYWPKVLAPNSREALTGLLKSGRALRSRIQLDIDSDMYEVNKFPREAVVAEVEARDITTEYLPGFPLLRNANGVARFIGNSLRLDATSGSVLNGTRVISAILTADDLHAPRAPMVVRMRLKAPASDVVTFLNLKHFTFDDDWNLNPATIKGDTEFSMRLGFDSFSDNPQSEGLNLNAVNYDIRADVRGLAQASVVNALNVRDLSGVLHTSNTVLSFDGRLGLGAATGLNVSLQQEAGGAISADVSGTLPRSEFSALGIAENDWIKDGNLGVNAHIVFGKNTAWPTRATLDITDLALSIPELSWKKARGEKGTISLTRDKDSSRYMASFSARDLRIADARLTLDSEHDLAALTLPSIQTNANDFALDYAKHTDGYRVSIKGKKLDASDAFATSENGLLANFPPISLDIDLESMTLVPGAPLRELKGSMICNRTRCESMQITAKTGKGMLTAAIKPAVAAPKKSRREFLLSTSDAGELLRALDITDRLYDGRLELSGRYDDTQQPAPLNGRLLITNFSLKNSQILGRIVSLASITGVGDAITGSTQFEKLGAGITHRQGVVNISKGKATGAALGITLEGKVDTSTTQMNIKGVLVPANLINSLFTKIPIIGWVAGKEGEGLIAFNYKVDGSYADPDIRVNPFSGLTPGVLRNVFSGEPMIESTPDPKKKQ